MIGNDSRYMWVDCQKCHSPNVMVSGYIIRGYILFHGKYAFEALEIGFIPYGNSGLVNLVIPPLPRAKNTHTKDPTG